MRTTTISTLLLASASTLVSAADKMNLFVAAGNGYVHTVQYDPAGANGLGKLEFLHNSTGCGETPTWLYKGLNKTRVWCLDEGAVSGNGSINRLDISADGVLTQAQHRQYQGSPVQGGLCFEDKWFCSAVYGGMRGSGTAGGMHLDNVVDGTLMNGKAIIFPAIEPGPKLGQKVSRGHGIATDPTNNWVVVPDLGADELRIFDNHAFANITEGVSWSIRLERGTGPRHAVFYSHVAYNKDDESPNGWFLYLVSEMANTITAFNVFYVDGKLQLAQSSKISTFAGSRFANDSSVLANAKAAEIRISPDGQFLSVSNRNVSSNLANTTMGDSINTFFINSDGSLRPVQYVELGLRSPRAFEFNPQGDRVLVSFAKDSQIAVYRRDVATGRIDNAFAPSLPIWTGNDPATAAGVNHAIWDHN
jgi:6-phosphogluconolactonase (cycloisomerase 2 family)